MDKDLELLGKICQQYGLGKPECPPVVLKGGFLHKMYSLFTPGGRYAVKLLNPYIMQRETAMENYRTAERLEAMLEEQGFPFFRHCGLRAEKYSASRDSSSICMHGTTGKL